MNNLNFELLRENDTYLKELKELFELPEIEKWIHISENYFDYIIQTEMFIQLKFC